MCAGNGWQNGPPVIAAADAIHACMVILSSNAISIEVARALMSKAEGLLGGPQAWVKCRDPIAALVLSMRRICCELKELGPSALICCLYRPRREAGCEETD
eukprot:1211370-Pyramimonas_sp.AAC.1